MADGDVRDISLKRVIRLNRGIQLSGRTLCVMLENMRHFTSFGKMTWSYYQNW